MQGVPRETRLVVLGPGGVGKTSLCRQFVMGMFVDDPDNWDETFRKAIEWTAGVEPNGVAIGHLDDDPSTDLVVTSEYGYSVSVFLNPQIP